MQAMGAYGFRGLYEKKEHFMSSIPYAIKNLNYIISNNFIEYTFPELENAWEQIINSEYINSVIKNVTCLNISIQSFSYIKGIPKDDNGNGGGFVFDCRFIKNPGLFQEYKHLTGNDKEVIEYLKKETEIDSFMQHVYAIIDNVIENYKIKDYKHLMISFGCTGGRHRSVYCANMLYKYLLKNKSINVSLIHNEI
jgi:RNase adaptor protein for sRNA GlmZ degradation